MLARVLLPPLRPRPSVADSYADWHSDYAAHCYGSTDSDPDIGADFRPDGVSSTDCTAHYIGSTDCDSDWSTHAASDASTDCSAVFDRSTHAASDGVPDFGDNDFRQRATETCSGRRADE